MATNREKYEAELERLRKDQLAGRISEADEEAIRELCHAYDEDRFEVTPPTDANQKKKALSTRTGWCVALRMTAREVELTSANADSINAQFSQFLREDSQKRNTIRGYQSSARRFYRYHTELGLNPDDIYLIPKSDNSIDSSNMLTKKEIHTIREVAEHPRDLAIFDFLLYTGQRSMVIRSLRIQDVDLDEGVFYLNPEVDGLKGARQNGKKRPLLLAKSSIRDWLRYHPCPTDQNAYLFTSKAKFNKPNPHQMLSQESIARVCRVMKEKADIDKPLHPHMLRHNFVTIAKRDYELDDSTVKYLIGHSPDSRVMETTYAHLSGQDHIDHAEVKMGLKERKQQNSPLTPSTCPRCDEPLSDDAKACAKCGQVFTPDAYAAKDMIDDIALDGMREAENKDEADAVEKFRKFLKENPEDAVDILRDEL
jgi:integrase